MEYPLITVIIPCYNGSKYVRRCLDCIERQTYRHLEVLFVDDGSTDDSAKIAGEYQGVKVLQNDRNRGPAYARNRALQEASGEYVHFFDVDDRINSTYYESMVAAVSKTGADIIIGGAIFQRSGYHTQHFSEIKSYHGRDKYLITYPGRWGYSVIYLFRTALIREHEIHFPEGRLMEDIPFTIRVFYYAERVATAPGAEYLYIDNPDSILTKQTPEHREKRRQDRQYSRKDVRDFVRQKGVSIPAVNSGWLRFGLDLLKRKLTASSQKELTEDL
ncbi:MAG: glycosyltransferase family 2 protein [Porphyromonas sp.]|nr:glycosyltransferase family 2 protein [Porphyromonas sp.]